ncbi:hypothetical protein KR054_008733 [Drosophila jambulina]|nr:hypothetical protein KR054_008733 [Drosophila jambulina]
MKFVLILSCFVLYVALTSAQENCRGRPGHQDCDGGRNEGVRHAHGCDPEPNPEMWYYNRHTRECLKMSYRGCHGNSNRYCSKHHCERSCNRRD